MYLRVQFWAQLNPQIQLNPQNSDASSMYAVLFADDTIQLCSHYNFADLILMLKINWILFKIICNKFTLNLGETYCTLLINRRNDVSEVSYVTLNA